MAPTSHKSLQPGWRRPELALLVLLVMGIYFTRLTVLPITGEEPRWGRGAVQMLETGDWVVLRQQGQVFPERPPMSSWAMALVGKLRGKVDDVALRLPSVIAVLLTSVVIYFYATGFLSRFGAFTAGVVYATFGQVMQIGRTGESEALFTLLLGSSLLVWHANYLKGRTQLAAWIPGYALVAAAALVKGPQAPIYFVTVTGVYLTLRSDWRSLFTWQHVAGLATFTTIIGAWQIPYYLATDWDSVVATWTGLAGDRVGINSTLINHVLSYPLEIVCCLMPWSCVAILPAVPAFRGKWKDLGPHVVFLLTAICVTFPTVWLAVGARGRYFMPLYPCCAILIAVVIERSILADKTSNERHRWNFFLRGCSIAFGITGCFIATVSWIPSTQRLPAAQPALFAAIFVLAAFATAGILWWATRDSGFFRSWIAVPALAGFLGLVYTGVLINDYARNWNNPRPVVAQIKQSLSNPDRLVSLGPLDHRICYLYEDPIQELPWPISRDEIPPDVTHFCMNRVVGEGDQKAIGRGRTWTNVPNQLPFAYEIVAVVDCDRRIKPGSGRQVVFARIIPPAMVIGAAPDQTRLQ